MRLDNVERRQIGHVFVGHRHCNLAELGGDLLFPSWQSRPLAPKEVARPEVLLLPRHKGAAPQRAVGDDGSRHEKVLARVWSRRASQAPPCPESTSNLQQRACALAARVLEARCFVDDQHIEQRVIIR